MHVPATSPPPVADARSGNDALAEFAERLRPALWRYARVLGADAATADDLVQEAFVTTLRRADFEARDVGAVFTFLRTTCRNLWLRSRARTGTERDVDEADLVWTQRCGDGVGRAASGAAFGLSRDGVKSALRRLRSFLHDCITRRLETGR